MSFRQKLCNLFSRAYNFIKSIFKGDDADYLTYDTNPIIYILPNKPKKKKAKKKAKKVSKK